MGQQIAGTVNNAATNAQSDVSSLGTNFNSAVNQGVVNQDQNAVNNAVNAATSATASQGLTPDQISAYQNQANANYSGPTDVTSYGGYAQAQQDINNANQLVGETQSEAGRGTLLNNQYANTSQYGYTPGENNLDQLLLQNSPTAQAALQPLANQWSGLTGVLNNTVTTGNQAAQQAAITDQGTAQAAQSALNTASQSFQNNLNTGLTNLQNTNSAAWNDLQAAVASGSITPQEAAALNINVNDTNADSGHNYISPAAMGTYFTQGAAPTLASYANADQYAQAAALAQLAGQSTSPFLAPDSVSQAGTATNTPAFTANSTKYASDNQAAQAEYNSALNSALGVANNYVDPNTGVSSPWGLSSIPQAVSVFNQAIQAYGSYPASNGYGAQAAWAKQQLQNINQIQIAYGLQPYPIAGQAVVNHNPTNT